MQYILTQDERDNLIPKRELDAHKQLLQIAKEIIIRLSIKECKQQCFGCPLGGGLFSKDPFAEDEKPPLWDIGEDVLDAFCDYGGKYQDFPK